jgi:signal transduction histidine kinase
MMAQSMKRSKARPKARPSTRWQSERRTRMVILLAFAGIAVLLAISQVVAYLQWHATDAEVDVIEDNALASVRLVDRMGYDIQHERILIDRHIFEHDPARIAAVETEIAAARADYAVAARSYAPLATFEREATAWLTLLQDVVIVERQTAAALAASRDNRDEEAARLLVAAEPAFDAVSRDVAALVDINQAEADHAHARAAGLQVGALELHLGLAAAVLLITLFVGLRLARAVSGNERALGQQTIELERKNRELDAFAGRVAHDLKGPLNTINLAASILAERVPDETSTTSIMRRGIAQMTNLVEDLLGLSRAGTAAGAVAHTEPVAASVAADLVPLVTRAGGTLRVEVAPAEVQCGEGLLRQVLWNLAENAFKYRRTDEPPAIALVGRATDDGYVLEVSDNGLGLSPEDAAQVFEPLFRGERTRSIAGTGLGLAIVHRIVEASGGTIAVASEPGRGATFTVRLRLADASRSERDATSRAS